MFKFLIAILIFAGMIFPTQAFSNTQIESQVAQIYRDYGIRVLYKYNRNQFFGAKTQNLRANPSGEQMSDSEILRVLPVISKFLSFYPKEVINKNLNQIYLTKQLTMYGKSYGATYGKISLYLTNKGIDKGFTDTFLLGTMHSEFSSILMKNYFFSETVWKGANHSSFQYIGNGRDMLGGGDSYTQTSELLSKGLICKYAQASVEEDFNMMVYWLFTKPNELKELAKKYPIINSKMWMVIDFYQLSVDSRIKF